MRLNAHDVRSRVAITRLLIKAATELEFSTAIGIEDALRFRSEAAKYGNEVECYVKLSGAYLDHDRSV